MQLRDCVHVSVTGVERKEARARMGKDLRAIRRRYDSVIRMVGMQAEMSLSMKTALLNEKYSCKVVYDSLFV